MFASWNQNWLSAKYLRTTKFIFATERSRVASKTAERSNESVWRSPRISRLAPGKFFDLVFGECK